MKVAYIQPIGGISGDMLLASLMHVGLNITQLNHDLNKLGLGKIKIISTQNSDSGFSGLLAEIEYENKNWRAENFQDFISIVQKSNLNQSVKQKSIKIFTRFEKAENIAHQGQNSIHYLHELGTLDTFIDVVGVVLCLDQLQVEQVFSSPVPLNFGTVFTKHGLIPATAPATSALLTQANVPVVQPIISADMQINVGEIVTPTGAAILTTLANFELPSIKVDNFGYGFGQKKIDGYLNVLTTWIGTTKEEENERNQLILIETNIDNMSSEIIGFIQERLFSIGVNDVWTKPIYMKKNRPGITLSVLLPKDLESQVIDMIYNETTTLGLRIQTVLRDQLKRKIFSIESEFGKINVKLKYIDGVVTSFHPEYEDCKVAAEKFNKPYKEVYDSILNQAKEVFERASNI